jgi:trimethylamine:corrinoid methyltransferase-like protein
VGRNAHAGRTRSGGFALRVFTPDEFEDVHLRTLEVLEWTGVFVSEHEGLETFAAGGARSTTIAE